MDGQILGGGVILLVAGVLWLIYLVPSWQSRSQFNATERNAVRLSQALRVLAETSESPSEMVVELDTRTAYEQQKHARRAEAERLRLAKEAEFRRARLEVEEARTTAEQEQAELDRRRAEAIAARHTPELRQARARRRTRKAAFVLALAGLVATGVGVWTTMAFGMVVPLVAGSVTLLSALWVLRRMAVVTRQARKTAVVSTAVQNAPARRAPVVVHDEPRPTWTPRTLPQPMSTVAGSSAALVQDQEAARAALRRAAIDEATRQRAAAAAPTPITAARPAASAQFAHVGVVDDAQIEAHVRELLARRAAS